MCLNPFNWIQIEQPWQRKNAVKLFALLERATGIEPVSEAWEAYFKGEKRSNWRRF
jgi:hypothetical protein